MADIPGISLADYLASFRGRRWKPGELDCGVFISDWALRVCGKDPIADIRGSYSTEFGYVRIFEREGGFESSCTKRLSTIGYVETAKPTTGDLLIVLSPSPTASLRPTGSICVSDKMQAVVTSDKGVVIAPLPILKAFKWLRR